MNAGDIMTTHEIWTCAETSDAQTVARMMADHNVGAIPVLDQDGKLEGIVTDRDLCCQVLAEGLDLQTAVCEIMSEPVHFVRADTSLQEIESMMQRFKIHRLPVVDDDMRLIGFISIGDIACHCEGSEEAHKLVCVMEKVHSAA